MKIQVVRRILVKPCTPTPPHLRSYEISEMDEMNDPVNGIRIVYYPPDSVNGEQMINLKDSLAQVLSLFYPLAGRYLKEKRIIDCNDEGPEYVEAQVLECDLLHLIEHPDVEHLNHLLPLDIRAVDEPYDPVLAVQVSGFQCGGLAIGVYASHRIFDSCSVGLFLTAWANAAKGEDPVICPSFDSSSYFPAQKLSPISPRFPRSGEIGVSGKRFVFDKNAIAKQRDSIGPDWRSNSVDGPRPSSRVAVVSAFLAQALLRSDRAKHGKSRVLGIGLGSDWTMEWMFGY